jgi:FtsP/CotA-like multicopper oxidase with cupredoxin domain
MKRQSRIAASAVFLLVSVAAICFAQDTQDGSHRADERQFTINASGPLQDRGELTGGAGNRAHLLAADQAGPAMLARTMPATTSPLPPVLPVASPCPRYPAGSVVHNPPALFSSNGVLEVRFTYQQRFDSDGRKLLCFMTPDGLENPTLHLKPGDQLILTVTNNTPSSSAMMPILNAPNCGDTQATMSSINIHYHGTNVSPACHQDNVLRTVVNPGETFQYNVAFPANEPSGLYWYHPHIHMLAEQETQGGATGAIVVEGVENQQPAVSGLRERVLVVRDQPVPGNPKPTGNIPNLDLSLNFIPITSPTVPNATNFIPAILNMRPGEREFWRVTNTAADSVLDLQYVFDGVPQTLQLVAVDGVPLNSQDGTEPGAVTPVTHFTLPPASRVEFIVSPPPPQVRLAQLITLRVNGGPYFYNLPQRPLATVQLLGGTSEDTSEDHRVGTFTANSTAQQRFGGLGTAHVAMTRSLYFDEFPLSQYFMVVEGQPKVLFDPNAAPAIVATQGTVEEWTVENRTPENHAFHIHQIHFLVESQKNFEINGSQQAPAINGQYLDTVQVPFWDQNPNHPFPSVKLRLDFRGPDIGDFVFHCHVLSHEDAGMMAIVRVQPGSTGKGEKDQR